MMLVDVDTDISELSASIVSNTTLPHLESTDVERALNDNKRRRRNEARKFKREAREKKDQQRLEDMKQRKEERKLIREARRRRREARKKKRRQQMHHQVTYPVVPKMEMMMSPTKCQRGTRRRREERGNPTTINMPPYPLTILLCLRLTMIGGLSSLCMPASYLILMGLTLPSGST